MLTQQAYHARDSQGIEVRPFVLPPRSPKLNGHMERSHRTHNEEFCEVMAASDQLPTLNRQLLGWEHTCNCVCPIKPCATSRRWNS